MRCSWSSRSRRWARASILFHSTSDLRTACELDAGAPGCPETDAPADFCAWSRDEADQRATHACAWLGACETPLGDNAFGPCVFRARMAFDCAANPDHRVQGAAHDLWDCLQRAQSCPEVDACVFGAAGPPACDAGAPPTACAPGASRDVRVACGGARAFGEQCGLWGQTCATRDGGTACAGEPVESMCGEPLHGSGCYDPEALHWCEEDAGAFVDLGVSCASFGGGTCQAIPSPKVVHWVACQPGGDGGACAPSLAATCGGPAVMCPAGVTETLDCDALLGTTGACVAGDLSPPFDWTSACRVSPARCTGDACGANGALTSCERGAAFQVDCADAGLGRCAMVTADPASGARAACTPPPANPSQ